MNDAPPQDLTLLTQKRSSGRGRKGALERSRQALRLSREGLKKLDDGVGQQEKGAMRPPEAFCGRAETSGSLERLDGLSDLTAV